MALGRVAECGAGFDRQRLLGVAEEHDLGALTLGLRHDAVEATRAHYLCLVDDKGRIAGQPFAILPPLMFGLRNRARGDAGTMFEAFSRDA